MPLEAVNLNVNRSNSPSGRHWHMDAGEIASWVFTLVSASIPPVMAAASMTFEDKKTVMLMWFSFAVIYYWRKAKFITSVIDRKLILSSGTAKVEQILLFIPYLATFADLFAWIGIGSLHYGLTEWSVLIGTVVVASMVVDTNFSFINDLLKAAPIAERGEVTVARQ